MGHLATVRRDLENPLGINPGQGADEELRGLNDFTGDNPWRLAGARHGRRAVGLGRVLLRRFAALEERRPGEDLEQSVPPGLVGVALFPPSDVAGQPGEDRTMDGSVVGVAFVELQSAEIFQRVVRWRVK